MTGLLHVELDSACPATAGSAVGLSMMHLMQQSGHTSRSNVASILDSSPLNPASMYRYAQRPPPLTPLAEAIRRLCPLASDAEQAPGTEAELLQACLPSRSCLCPCLIKSVGIRLLGQ